MAQTQQISDTLTIAPDARIMMRWWWFGPSMTHAEVTRQLTLMHIAGIGGVEVAYVYPVCLDGEINGVVNQQFLSPAFCDVLRFAAEEAERLGLRFDLTLGSGWPFGGPHISPRHAAKQLKTQFVTFPAHRSREPLPLLGKHEQLITAVDQQGCPLKIDQQHLYTDEVYSTAQQITLLIASPTSQMVKRAANGAQGLVLDHYSEHALQVHLAAVGQKLLDAVGVERVWAIFTDSLEVYNSNWTADFLEQFKFRRGYDLAPFLPMLLNAVTQNDSGVGSDACSSQEAMIEDIQHDYAQTLTELLNDQFLKPLQQFAHHNAVRSRVQAYGVPPASLSSYCYVDLPEGEATLGSSDIQQPAEWFEITPNRMAASASRLKSHPVVSGETWTRLHSPPYAATPLDMKAEADQFFLQGVNQILGHGWCHRPEKCDPTQWVFYAAANFNEANPWHPVFPELSRYLQTICSLLRQGSAVVDVAIYLPDHDVWANQTLSCSKDNLHHVNAMREHIGIDLPCELLQVGLNFDLADDFVLQALANKKGDEAESVRYRMIVLPSIKRIPLATLQALRKLAEQSVQIVVLGHVPQQPIGYCQQEHEADAIQRLKRELFDTGDVPGIHVLDKPEGAAFRTWCTPDVQLEQTSLCIGYVHRKLGKDDLYFFANTSNQTVCFKPTFRDTHGYTYVLDPMTRIARPVNLGQMTLQAFESVICLRSDIAYAGSRLGDFAFEQVSTSAVASVHDISENWRLIFPDGECLQCDRLRPWTDWESRRSYVGHATYTRIVDMPDSWRQQRVELQLDEVKAIIPYRRDPSRRNTGYIAFADTPVKDAAEVFLNGKHVGYLFCPPYRINLTPMLQQGENLLEIKVYNRLINALTGKMLYDFCAVHETFGQRFDLIQDFKSLCSEPAGLAGMISLKIYK